MSVGSEGGPGTKRPERYTAENMDFAGLVMYAYDIKRFQIAGPDWIRSERYNISARVPPHATREQFRMMLQKLLAERFGLKAHSESREMPIYELVVAKGGPKLKDAAPEKPKDPDAAKAGPPKFVKGPDGFPPLPEGEEPVMMMMSTKNGPAAAMRARNETAEGIANTLSHQVGQPVHDATGLQGRYDFTLYWLTRSTSHAAAAVPGDPTSGPAAVEDSPGPTLFEAIQQQLGLKLQAGKGPVPVLVLDHVEKMPTAD